MEQRNGRIDRKLQPQPEVFCHYFVYPQRPEDRVLEVARPQDRDHQEGAGQPLPGDRAPTRATRSGRASATATSSAGARRSRRPTSTPSKQRDRRGGAGGGPRAQDELAEQIDQLRDAARELAEVDRASTQDHFRDAISCSLELLGRRAAQAGRTTTTDGPPRWTLPGARPARRAPTRPGPTRSTPCARRAQRTRSSGTGAARRRSARSSSRTPGTIDDDVVHLHLEHRVVQRLLGRFRAQGFVHHDLSRACLAQTARRDPARDPARPALASTARAPRGCTRSSSRSRPAGSSRSQRKEPLDALRARGRGEDARPARAGARSASRAEPSPATDPASSSWPPRRATSRSSCPTSSRAARSWPTDAATKLARARRAARPRRCARSSRRSSKRIVEAAASTTASSSSSTLDFDDEEQRAARSQHAALGASGSTRSTTSSRREPERIREFYEVKATRIEPVGLVYLWPVTS